MSARSRQIFLETFDRERATTMKLLRAYPEDQPDLKPSPKSNSARQLAWTFANECYLGAKVWSDAFAQGLAAGAGTPPQAPEKWSDLLAAVDQKLGEWRELVANTPESEVDAKVHFFTAPKTMGEITRMDWAWFLLHDQIHHRGQFSVYVRIAGGKVPSIYGPSADEPWM
jgi:uncharacterized damage-inducible protein DinB